MMDNTIHILLIEDDPAHAELIQRAFEDRGDESKLTIAHTLAAARDHLTRFIPTLIIADWRLPDGDSSELVREEGSHPTIPVIIMTSYGSERNAVNVIKSGALDYIVFLPEEFQVLRKHSNRKASGLTCTCNQQTFCTCSLTVESRGLFLRGESVGDTLDQGPVLCFGKT